MSRVNRTSLREQIRDILVDRILSGHYKPGDRLVELQLAEEFGSSQGPVREALRELAAQNLVLSESHRGTRVLALSADDIREIYDVREALECHAMMSVDGRLDIDWSSLIDSAEATYREMCIRDSIMLRRRRRHRVSSKANPRGPRAW